MPYKDPVKRREANKRSKLKRREELKAQGLRPYEYWLTEAAKKAVDKLLKQLDTR